MQDLVTLNDNFNARNMNHEEAVLNKYSQKGLEKRKLVSFAGNILMFEDELEKPLHFISSRISRRKFVSRSLIKKRMNSAPKSLKDIPEYQLHPNSTASGKITKFSNKLIIDGAVFTVEDLIENKFERRQGYIEGTIAGVSGGYQRNDSQSKRLLRMKSLTQKKKYKIKSLKVNSNQKMTKTPKKVNTLKDASEIFGKIMEFNAKTKLKKKTALHLESDKSSISSHSTSSISSTDSLEESDFDDLLIQSIKKQKGFRTKLSHMNPVLAFQGRKSV